MLKAMSNNCAILALDTRFNKEMLRNGELGLLFNESMESIINAMKKLEKHPEFVEQLKAEVSSGLTDKYNWDSVTTAYQLAMSTIYK
jgi:glycosyltransferase involved in cell wall biosynthesis